jgi:hypothetical protein
VFPTHVASILAVFGRILQVFHLDVAKVDRVLHMFFQVFCKCFSCF